MDNVIKTINYNNLNHNISVLKKINNNLCAVVKANAYGHGIENIVSFLDDKVCFFAVNTIDEAKKARKHTTKPILVLCGFSFKDLSYASQNNIHLAVFCKKQALNIEKYVRKQHKIVCLHLKFDTGMNRLGLKDDVEIEEICDILRNNKEMKLCGIMSHIGGGNNERIKKQMLAFRKISNKFDSSVLRHIKSSSTSSAIQKFENEMLRCGLSVYGYGCKNLKPILKIEAKIIFIGSVNAGEFVGYGTKFVAKKKMRYAVLGIGYADGLFRNYENGYVILHGKKAKICAQICMNMTIVDITNINACVGDYAIVLDENINANIIAKKCKTIPYEILTNFK